MTDTELLAEFVRTRSPQAFAELVRRYLDLVYGTARRMVGDGHVAEDVTQAAFLVLAKKARGVDPLTLPGWLVNTARLAAREAMRAKFCRQQHESRAAQMRSEIQTSREEPTAADLAPLLDDALAQLSAADRSAVVLRFLQGRSFVEVGLATGISEEAARKRVERALDKLRLIFLKKGFVPSVGGLMLLLASQQAARAPAAVVGSVLSAVHLGGTATSAILAKGVAAAMTWAKIKLAAVVILVITLIGGVGVGFQTIRRAMAEAATTIAVPSTVPVATSAIAGSPFKAVLRSGVGIELIGLAPNPSEGQAWWLPDGNPLAQPPYPRSVGTTVRGPTQTPIEVAIRLTAPAGVDIRGATLTAGLAGYWTAVVPVPDIDEPGLYEIAGGRPGTDTAGTLHVRLAWGAWSSQTQLTMPAQQAAADTKEGHFELRNPRDQNGRAMIDATLPLEREDREMQVLAVDNAGQLILSTGSNSSSANGKTIASIGFPLPLARVKEFRVRTRPYDGWIKFLNVSLKPGVKTDVQVATSDDLPTTQPATNPAAANDSWQTFAAKFDAGRAAIRTLSAHFDGTYGSNPKSVVKGAVFWALDGQKEMLEKDVDDVTGEYVKRVFDGQVTCDIFGPAEPTKQNRQQARLYHKKPTFNVTNVLDRFVFGIPLFRETLSEYLKEKVDGKRAVSIDRRVDHRRAVTVVSISEPENSAKVAASLWFDTDKNAIIRYEGYFDGVPEIVDTVDELREVSPGLWLPVTFTETISQASRGGGLARRAYTTKDLQVNGPVAASLFDTTPPPGSLVRDDRTGKEGDGN